MWGRGDGKGGQGCDIEEVGSASFRIYAYIKCMYSLMYRRCVGWRVSWRVGGNPHEE